MLDLLIIGIAIALDPLPLIPFILVLTSRRGTAKGAAFIVGWLLSLSAITVATLLLTGGESPESGSLPSDAALAVRIAIGVGLVAYGLWRRRRPPLLPGERTPPKWQKSIDSMSLPFALVLAPITQPWGLIAGGVTSIMDANLASAQSVVVLIAFVVLATSTYLGLEVFSLVRRDRAHALATGIRMWIESHTRQALTWGALAVGLFLIASGTYQLIA